MAARKAASAGFCLREDFAAAMEPRVEEMLSGLARERQRFVDPGQSGFRASSLGFDFREQTSIERQIEFGWSPSSGRG